MIPFLSMIYVCFFAFFPFKSLLCCPFSLEDFLYSTSVSFSFFLINSLFINKKGANWWCWKKHQLIALDFKLPHEYEIKVKHDKCWLNFNRFHININSIFASSSGCVFMLILTYQPKWMIKSKIIEKE